ncbi:unnamed protein product [Spirodela intermedia]|uniref:Uncharacterized protein n=1 Tax=Spirodela intermedia TaxID=51605 RepID=A0A7I8KPS3_SPIIN|nr:unnamed protein product [Spirodela intermedia]
MGRKWIHTIKYDIDHIIERYKA